VKKDNDTPEIAIHAEILALLTQEAREGSTQAMVALDRALRAIERQNRGDDVDAALHAELDEILGRDPDP
jgi:hypothetical protein